MSVCLFDVFSEPSNKPIVPAPANLDRGKKHLI